MNPKIVNFFVKLVQIFTLFIASTFLFQIDQIDVVTAFSVTALFLMVVISCGIAFSPVVKPEDTSNNSLILTALTTIFAGGIFAIWLSLALRSPDDGHLTVVDFLYPFYKGITVYGVPATYILILQLWMNRYEYKYFQKQTDLENRITF